MHRERRIGEAILCEVIHDRFEWFANFAIYDNVISQADDTDPAEFLAVFFQTLCRVKWGS